MFYVSKVSPLFFLLAWAGLFLSLFRRGGGYSDISLIFPLLYCFIGFTLMGAMYQIVPNSQNRALVWKEASYLSFGFGAISFALFLFGQVLYSSLLYLVASSLLLLQVLLTVRNWTPPTVRFLGLSSSMLFLSSLFLLLHIAGYVGVQVAVHTLTVGSMLSAIYGVEGAWIPMLTMETLSLVSFRRLFYMKLISTLVVVAGFLLYSRWILLGGGLLELLVFLRFVFLVLGILRRRRSPAPVPPVVKVFLLAFLFMGAGITIALFMILLPQFIPVLAPFHLNFMVFGFGAMTIMGGMSHLLPRILWQAIRKHSAGEKLSIGDLSIDGYLFKMAVVGLLLLLIVSWLDFVGMRREGTFLLGLFFGAFYLTLFGKPIFAIRRAGIG